MPPSVLVSSVAVEIQTHRPRYAPSSKLHAEKAVNSNQDPIPERRQELHFTLFSRYSEGKKFTVHEVGHEGFY